jgi:hypothetical protein
LFTFIIKKLPCIKNARELLWRIILKGDRMKQLYNPLLLLACLIFISTQTSALPGSWTPVTHAPPLTGTFAGLGFPHLMTDGTVIAQQYNNDIGTGLMWKLTPNNAGSYINGTWSQIASLPVISSAQYAPLYHASAVLPDGRLIFMGGQYNGSALQVWTNLGAIYNPVTNSWTSVTAPSFFSPYLGDACSVVLANGTFMLADPFYNLISPPDAPAATLNATTLAWTQTGAGKSDSNNQEGWTLLPNGKVLTVDVYVGTHPYPATPTNSEIFDPSTGNWSTAGSTIHSLTDPVNFQIGPAILMPNGNVFAVGDDGNTSIYNSSTGGWAVGPTLPMGPGGEGQLGCMDAPAALLPNGNVLLAASPINPVYNAPTYFYEFNGSAFTLTATTTNAPHVASYNFGMLVLPSGQILSMDTSADVEIYTPADSTHNAAWEPVIYCSPKKVQVSKSYQISGLLFNGMSQASMYGDDYQAATNYPLVRITNNATGHVFYCHTHDHTYMGVAAPSVRVSTTFDVPLSVETGKSTLQVVTNGIPSQPVCIYVAPATC